MFGISSSLLLAGGAAAALFAAGCSNFSTASQGDAPYYAGSNVGDRGGPGWGGVWRDPGPTPADWNWPAIYHSGNGGGHR